MKKIRPNHLMYNLLLAITFVIVYEGLEHKDSKIIYDIGIGCLSSVIIAWLIDIGMCKAKNFENRQAIDITYMKLYLLVTMSFQIYANACACSIKTIRFKNQSHNIEKWFQIYKYVVDSDRNKQNSKLHQCVMESWNYYNDKIIEEINLLLDNIFIMRNQNIIDESKIYELTDLKDMCKFISSKMKRNSNTDEQMSNLWEWTESLIEFASITYKNLYIINFKFNPYRLYYPDAITLILKKKKR